MSRWRPLFHSNTAKWMVCVLCGGEAWAQDACRAGEQAIARRDMTAAEDAMRQCIKARPSVDAYLMLCGVYQVRGDEPALLGAALEAVRRFPAEKRFYSMAGTYAGRQKRFDEAIGVLGSGAKRWAGDGKLRSLLESAYVGRGMELLNAGKNAEAEADFRRAVELAPDDLEALMNLGRALHNLHKLTDAVAVFDRVIQKSPALPLARFHRGMAWHALGAYDQAIADLGEEIRINPAYAPAYLTRGMAFSAKGEWENAARDLDSAAAQMPDDAKTHYAWARALIQLTKLTEAEKALRRSIELDPSDPAPLNALVRLLVQTGRASEAAPLRQQAAALAEKQRSASPGEIRFSR